MYFDKYFSDHSEKEVREIFEEVRDALMESMRQSQWMDEATKQSVLRKVAAIKFRPTRRGPGVNGLWSRDEVIKSLNKDIVDVDMENNAYANFSYQQISQIYPTFSLENAYFPSNIYSLLRSEMNYYAATRFNTFRVPREYFYRPMFFNNACARFAENEPVLADQSSSPEGTKQMTRAQGSAYPVSATAAAGAWTRASFISYQQRLTDCQKKMLGKYNLNSVDRMHLANEFVYALSSFKVAKTMNDKIKASVGPEYVANNEQAFFMAATSTLCNSTQSLHLENVSTSISALTAEQLSSDLFSAFNDISATFDCSEKEGQSKSKHTAGIKPSAVNNPASTIMKRHDCDLW